MLAVAYLLDPSGSGEVIDVQRRAIEAWAARECVEITSWQLDAVDGDTPIAERPGLMAAYQAIRDVRAGILVAANATTFAQDQLVAWLIERAALASGAELRTADGSKAKVEAPAAGYTRGGLDLATAYERVTRRYRIRKALEEKRAKGERTGAIPFGFRLALDGRHLEPNEAEQSVIMTVCELSNDGLSQRAIVIELANRGVKGRTGAPLRQTQVANILRTA